MIGIGIVVYLGMRYLLPVTVPFFVGWILAAKVLPAAEWMEKHWKLPRGVGGGSLIFLLTAIIFWTLWRILEVLLLQTKNLVENIGIWIDGQEKFLRICCGWMERYTGIKEEQIRNFLIYQVGMIQEHMQSQFSISFFEYFTVFCKGITVLAGGIITAILFGTLILKDMKKVREKICENKVLNKISEIGKGVCYAGGKYLRAQGILMVIVSMICSIGFWILKNPYFLFAGILTGFLDLLPLIGTGTVLIPWSVLWCLRGEYITALGYFLLYLVADLTKEFLEPRILGKQIGIHPAIMIAAVYGGFFLFGFSGFFLGPLMFLILLTVWKELNGNLSDFNKKDIKKSQKS